MSRFLLGRPLAPLAPLLALALLAAGACRVEDGTTPPTGSTSTGNAGSGGIGEGGSGSGGSGGFVLTGEPLKVLTWNARNFFDNQDNSTATGEEVVTLAQYQQKRAAVGAVLRDRDADVVVLQEIENLGILQDLNEQELAGAYPYAALVDSPDPRGIDVGALSKIPFDDVVSHVNDTFTKEGTNGPVYTFARDALELHLTYAGQKVVLIGVHFRSKGPPDDPDKRLAEAQYTRTIADGIAAADPTAGIAVLGDFNDLPGSPPVLAIQGGSGEALYDDVAMLAPQEDRWTYDFNGSLELVDHQMANPVLRARLDPASVTILHGPMVEDASDHAPIMATYLLSAP